MEAGGFKASIDSTVIKWLLKDVTDVNKKK